MPDFPDPLINVSPAERAPHTVRAVFHKNRKTLTSLPLDCFSVIAYGYDRFSFRGHHLVLPKTDTRYGVVEFYAPIM